MVLIGYRIGQDGSGGEFIEKRVIRTILKEVASDTDCESWPKDQVSDDEENDRMAVTNWTDSVSVIEYHVVWHFGYSVPVLYFRAFRSGKPFALWITIRLF